MKSALILTNHLHAWAGSEIVTLEVAEELIKKYSVTICANVIANEIIKYADTLGIRTCENPHELDLFDFDFIWSQHSMAPLCKGFQNLENHKGQFFSVHLSPNTSFELIGLSFASGKANAILANSEETKARIHQIIGKEVPVINFNNAAPSKFENNADPIETKSKPSRILIVSNHLPQELKEAANLLAASGIKIEIFGIGQENYKRISPDDIDRNDAVISIGKTVQYSILGQRPCYCYDHFGGPGWITRENFVQALAFNFSGRCCNTHRDAKRITEEILTGYKNAHEDVIFLQKTYGSEFNLGKAISKLENKTSKLHFSVRQDDIHGHSSALIRKFYRTAAVLGYEKETKEKSHQSP